jgi:hypothetical protein
MKLKSKQIGYGLVLIGIALFIAPSLQPLDFIWNQNTIYCPQSNEWYYIYADAPGINIPTNPLQGIYTGCELIGGGAHPHDCPIGMVATCLQNGTLNYGGITGCIHWKCITPITTCTTTCPSGQSQNAFPDCSCHNTLTIPCATTCPSGQSLSAFPDCSCYNTLIIPPIIPPWISPDTPTGQINLLAIGMIAVGGFMIIRKRR